MTLKKYYLDDYLESVIKNKRSSLDIPSSRTDIGKLAQFEKLCDKVKLAFSDEMSTLRDAENSQIIKRQKAAILGELNEVKYYEDKISEYLKLNELNNEWYPSWHESLVSAIFHENWGLSVMAPWVKNYKSVYSKSSSAKIIGNEVYYMIDGVMTLQPQRISSDKLDRFRKSLIIDEPRMKITDPVNDVYLRDGTRVTILGEHYCKKGRRSVIFRKFGFDNLTLEEQIELNTIPPYSDRFFKLGVKLGFNVLIVGPPNTGKSTFYKTLQMYEKKHLQGVQIETDPEVNLHQVLPGSPIMELLADGEDLQNIMKPILRCDPDYITMTEAREGFAADLLVRAANKGTRRVKGTYHITDARNICMQLAEEIVECKGGSLKHTTIKVAKSFSYVYEFFYLNNSKNTKKLKSIYEITYNNMTHEITLNLICKFNIVKMDWEWCYHMSEDKLDIGYLESVEETQEFRNLIKKFSSEHPLNEESEFKPQLLD